MQSGHGVDRTLSISDVPRLVAEASRTAPERTALTLDGARVTLLSLHRELSRLDAAMGGALEPDSLLALVIADIAPGLLDSDDGALDRVTRSLLTEVSAVLGLEPSVGPSTEARRTLVDAFDAGVDAYADRIAVRSTVEQVTYEELDRRSNRVARYLVSMGVGPDRIVGLAASRSVDLVVGMYAIIKAGGAYLPLDLDHPRDRLEYIVGIADPVLILTDGSGTASLPDGVPVTEIGTHAVDGFDESRLSPEELVSPLREQNLAYVMFTSGSTGRPKGVAVPHSAIMEHLSWRQRRYEFRQTDVVLQKTPYTFDVSVWEFFLPLHVGAKLVLAEPDGHLDPGYLSAVIRDEGVTVVHFVPSMLAVFVDSSQHSDLRSLRYVFSSGEELPASAATRFAAISAAELHNLYGPTEAAIDVTHHHVVDGDSGSIPIGAGVDGTELHVLDAGLQPVPPGTAGELYVTGVQLARGYVSRPGTTADRFVADPFAVGNRMYRTGDVVKRTSAGLLVYLGRTDFQVKLRGLRIELGEIEAVLQRHRSVSQSVVVVRADRLVGYVVASRQGSIELEELWASLRETLPEYMLPTALTVLDSMPLGSSGKLDRRSLPEPAENHAVFSDPVSDTEIVVAEEFSALLGVTSVGREDDFFALGGTSLSATRLVSRLNARLEVRTAVREFFDTSTVAGWALVLDSAERRTAGGSLGSIAWPEQIPLAPAQQRMWFLNRFDPSSSVDNIGIAIRLSGPLDVDSLRGAIDDLVIRHSSLRTRYREVDGVGTQVVLGIDDVDIDWRTTRIEEAQLDDHVGAVVTAPFDVTAAPPFRVRLLELGPREHVLVVAVHHIAADGFSMVPLTTDVMTAYAARADGRAPTWSPLPVEYVDYTLWHRAALGSPEDPDSLGNAQERYWASALSGVPDALTLPTDRPRPQVWSGRGAKHVLAVGPDTHGALTELAGRRGTTLFMVVHAALAVLLSRLSGSADVVVGTPVAGRGEAVLDDVIGMFVNTLVLRTAVDGSSSFDEVLAGVREVDLSAFAHADVPFERVVEVVDPPRLQGVHPIFQVMVTFAEVGNRRFELAGLGVDAVDMDATTAKVDLDFTVIEKRSATDDPAGLSIAVTYASDLFDAATIESLAERVGAVLDTVVANPSIVVGDLELVGDNERRWLLDEVNATGHEFDRAATLASVFDAQVARTPNAVAITFEGESTTYREFDARVNRVARYLIDRGSGPEATVAVALPRSLDLMVALYAVVKTGAAYVPVDPTQPADRIAYILETAQVTLVVASSSLDGARSAAATVVLDDETVTKYSAEPITDADRIASLTPDNTAYVLFTSGSTGTPKGVAMSHSAIVNRLVWMQTEYCLTDADAVLQKTPITFDVSVWELFWPLQVGARLVIARPDGHRDPAYLTETIEREHVSVAHFVPSMLGVFTAELVPARVGSLRWVFASGEALPPSTAHAFVELVPRARLVNLYGPTEAAVDVTSHEFDAADVGGVPIGLPVFNTAVRVLDGRLHLVAVGAVGELYLGGVQLARGYSARPDLTADRFVADPFGRPGDRLYRTGDLVRWSSSGELEYLGRSDFQVKLRGLRIELGEIENALARDDSVSQAVVAVRTDRLVAYVVPPAGGTVDTQALLRGVARTVPEYMVPAVVLVLDALPLGPAGKLDRKSLPEPLFERRVFREPVTETERIVAGVFGDLLGVTEVGLDDDFFGLGGNSLIATQVVSRLGVELDTQVPVRAVFDASTVESFAALLADSAGTGARIPLEGGHRPADIPLSLAQQRMWFLHKLEPNSAAYHIPIVVRLRGELDLSALARAIDDVRHRHEPLRTVYPEYDGIGHQVILPFESSPFELGVDECSEKEALRLIREMVLGRFALADSAPFRAHVYRLGGAENILAVVVHHIAADGFSMGPLMRDVVHAYAARASGTEPGWEPLPVQYADFAVWQRKMLGDESDPQSVVSRQLDFWTRQLDGIPEQVDLPTDRPRPSVPSERGGLHAFRIGADVHRSIVQLGLDIGCTPFMIVHAAFAILLARMSGSEDIVIGTPVAGRGERDLDEVIGMFVNTLVLRTEVRDSVSVRELLASTRDVDLDALAHVDIPFERLVEVLDPPRSTARQPLFQVMLAFQNLESVSVELPNIAAAGVELETGLSKFDLYLTMSEEFDSSGEPVGMQARLLYLEDLFDEATVAATGERFERILGAVVADRDVAVGDLDVLVGGELQSVVHEWNRTGSAMTDERLLDRYRRQVASTPDAVAITFGDESITYGEFDFRVRGLAGFLSSMGIGAESTVAVAMARSVELVVGIYAVVAAGAAYVPVDPGQPDDRVRGVLNTAAVTVVLSTSRDRMRERGFDVVNVDELRLDGVLERRPEHLQAAEASDARTHPDSAAYVLFTSGSTGEPKGVVVSHRAIVNRLTWMRAEYGLHDNDVMVLKTPVTFDVSLWELFLPLQIGARLVIAEADGHRDPRYLAHLFRSESVTVAHFVPSMLTVFAAESAASHAESLRFVFTSGESLPVATAQSAVEVLSPVRIVNLYGPTEAAVDVTGHEFAETDTTSVPIGRPVSGTRAYVLDRRLRPVAPGVVGELYLAGVQLARGYASRPDLTAERFVADPVGRDGGRLYRTGDLVRWTRSGELDFIGRRDFQIKLRGQRIELGEIEHALAAHPGVAHAVVVLRSDGTLGDALVGYVVPQPGWALDGTEVRAGAKGKVPDYMVPAAVMVLDALPVSSNGKLDRRALPEPAFEVGVFRPPSTPIEELVSGIYRDLLGVDRAGLDDDFFALGGNSLTATRVVSRLGAALGGEVSLRTLFEAPSVEMLSARVEHDRRSALRPAITARGAHDGPIPLSLAQQRMWFLNRLDPSSAAHNVPVTIRLSGELDVDALVLAFGDVIARHDILRTVYPDIDGVGFQVIEPASANPVRLDAEDVTAGQTMDRVLRLVDSGFDVTAAVPVRACVLRESVTEHVLVLVAHHIAVDGFSVGPLTRDLVRAYAVRAAGQAPDWDRPAIQYADFAVWQRAVLGAEDDPSSVTSMQVDYWRAQLADLPSGIELPTDRVRPTESSAAGATVSVSIDAESRARVSAFAHRAGATEFMVLHSTLSVLVARLTASDDIVIGTPVAGRGHSELDDMIGMFVNTLALRVQVDIAGSFSALLSQVRDVDLSAFAHADLPFEKIVDVVDPPRIRGRHPLFQVVFTYQNLGQVHLELPNLTVGKMEFDSVRAKFDVQVTVSDTSSAADGALGWNVEFLYATDLFDRSTVERFAEGFIRLLGGLLDAPNRPIGDIESMSDSERTSLVREWSASAPGGALEHATLVDRFYETVLERPDLTAVRFDGRSWTYGDVGGSVDALARHLITCGARPETLVAVALPRSISLVVALLAVSVSGAAYLPVDPSYPMDRIEFMIDDADPVLALVSGATSAFGSVPVLDLDLFDFDSMDRRAVTDADRHSSLRSDHLAYVIYTSGSTGRPKGVGVTHGNVLELFGNTTTAFGFDADDVWTMFHSYAFDFSVWEMWGALIHGGTLVVVDYYTSRSPQDFLALLSTERVTVLNQTPSAFQQLAEADRELPQTSLALRYVLFGGEALDPRRLAEWYDRHGDGTGDSAGPTLVNLYGITETTVHVTVRPLSSRDVSSSPVIGAPIPGLRLYVLDRRLRPVHIGVAGEVYVGGGQLARGYIGRSGLSAVRFVADPFGGSGDVLYRTGDRARWVVVDDVAELEYVGRADDQVKIRGFRIELGEVETAVSAQRGVSSAAVVVHDDPGVAARLVAYVVFADGASADIDDVRSGVTQWVPDYMVPSVFVPIDSIPLTVNGKLDRAALPSPFLVESEYRPPSTAVETVVANVYAEVLGVDRVGADADFFDLGGNSLVATRVVSRLGSALETVVPVRLLFESSTVSDLAARLESSVGEGGRRRLVARTRPATIPLSHAQQRMWLLNRLDPTSGAHNISSALRLSGAVDIDVLARALKDVVGRHESLRTRYPDENGVGSQEILPLSEVDLNLVPEVVDETDMSARVGSVLTASFDVTVSVPLRVRLLELSDTEHILVIVVHHIAADGFSIGPLIRDLMTAYSARSHGRTPEWTPLTVQYADYALWQREILGDESDPTSLVSVQEQYWRRTLDGLEEQAGIATDRPRPRTPSRRGATHEFVVDRALTDALVSVSREHQSTLFMILHAGLAVLLAKLSGEEDIAVGTPVAGRGEQELDDLVGMFVNTLALRTPVSPDHTLADILRGVRDTDLDAFAHADVPFERIVELIDPPRSSSKTPFFQVILALQNHEAGRLELPGLSVTGMEAQAHSANYDMQIVFSEERSTDDELRLTCVIVYATDLYDRSTVESFVERLTGVLRTVAQAPGTVVRDVDISSAGDSVTAAQIDDVEKSSSVKPQPMARTLAQMFEETVEADPSAPAVVIGEAESSYLEVSRRVAQTAHFLVSRGIGPGHRVVVDLQVTASSVIAMWAVWSCGASVLLDTRSSLDRVTDVDHVVLTTSSCASSTGSAGDRLRVIVMDEPDIATDIAAQSTRLPDYASRTRSLSGEDEAFVVPDAAGDTVVSQREAVTLADRCVDEWSLDYDSRTLLAVRGPTNTVGAWQTLAMLAAASSGSALVMDPGESDLDEVIDGSWVTHVLAASSVVGPAQRTDVTVVNTDTFSAVQSRTDSDRVSREHR
ncbi:amino acid adenylation domain-containing protein [Rhodococcus sp. IEGM 1370]|uniref:non-ribosomal peptide synthetase n=1 Tax=Rhodococcus sp. IEGM 1370 TaxID=3082222 RepID=UPI002954CF5B|nr:non-ribosomal peptide synthetase [Rhodococcus sp. IEGM 1370]MDV8075437.1 amino acid adenylation domain-containing protein [Rhodococcus sp. IEGM 1370]